MGRGHQEAGGPSLTRGRQAVDRSAGAGDFWEVNGDYYPVAAFPETRPCHGREQIVAFLADFLTAWDEYSYTVKTAKAIADDRVLLHGHMRARGRVSGASMDGDIYHCCWLRHGRFIRIEDHLTEKGALNALGIRSDSLEAAELRE